MGIFLGWKTKDRIRFVGIAFLFVVLGFFFFLSTINWLLQQDNAFYQRPSVTASSLHALRRMIFVIVNPAASLPDSWGPMFAAYEVFVSSSTSIYQETFFKLGTRFQYPPSSLLVIDVLNALHLQPQVALPQLNIVFFLLFALTSGLIAVVSFEKVSLIKPWQKLVQHYCPNVTKADLPFHMEFVLWALVEFKQLSKKRTAAGLSFNDLYGEFLTGL